MTPLALRVAARYATIVEAARWDNAMNGTYVSMHWNRTLWQVEESDTPITSMRDMSEQPTLDTYTMPTLMKDLAGRSQEFLMNNVTPDTIRQYAHIHADDKGPVVREKILSAYQAIFDAVVEQWKEDGDMERLAVFEKLLPILRRKLVWKKV